MRFPALAALFLTALTIAAVAADLPGQRPDGSVLLPNQWILRPVGKQIAVGDFPVNLALHPEGKFAAVLHCGYSQHEVVLIDLAAWTIASRTKVAEAFYGLAFSKDGKRLFCSGSAGEVIYRFQFADGQLTPEPDLPLRDPKQRGVPSGLAVSNDGQTVYAANLWGQSVSRVRLPGEPAKVDELLLTDKAVAPAPAAEPSTDDPSITKRDAALLETTDPAAPFPYACLLDEKRERLYVSLWGQATVAVIDTKSFKVTARWATEEHPNEMVLSKDGRRLYVANANRNTVSVLDTATGRTVETLLAELQPECAAGQHAQLARADRRRAAAVRGECQYQYRGCLRCRDAGQSAQPRLHPGWLVSDERPPDARRQNAAGGQWQRRNVAPESARPEARLQVAARNSSIYRRADEWHRQHHSAARGRETRGADESVDRARLCLCAGDRAENRGRALDRQSDSPPAGRADAQSNMSSISSRKIAPTIRCWAI